MSQPDVTRTTANFETVWWETPSITDTLGAEDSLPVEADSTVPWEELKLAGNLDFKSGKHADAVGKYSAALRSYAAATELTLLLLNHSATMLDEQPLHALMSASAGDRQLATRNFSRRLTRGACLVFLACSRRSLVPLCRACVL
jgi:hypothetical protein